MGQQQQVERIRITLEGSDRKLIEEGAKRIIGACCHTGATWQGPAVVFRVFKLRNV